MYVYTKVSMKNLCYIKQNYKCHDLLAVYEPIHYILAEFNSLILILIEL